MKRDKEIIILIQYLIDDVKKTINNYPNLISSTIKENGELINKYEIELEQLKNNNI